MSSSAPTDGAPDKPPEYEKLGLHFMPGEWEPGWKAGYSTEIPNQYSLTEFIREGDDIENWKELLSVSSFPPAYGGHSPEGTLNQLRTVKDKECPGVTKWNVISKDESSILYEWRPRPCLKRPDQHEIARIIHGKNNTFIIAYTQKRYQMPDDERSKWVMRISAAGIESNLQ